jgi:hypothetical protein
MRNTTAVIGGQPIAVLLQCIWGVSAINPLVAFYDIHGGMDTTHPWTPHETVYIEQKIYKIDVLFQETFLTNDELCLILSPASRA